MIASAAQALGQMFDRSFRGVLWLGIGCTFSLFVILFMVLQWAAGHVPDFGYAWIQDVTKIIAGGLLAVVFIFLGAPIGQLFASIFLDRVANAVEQRHYPKALVGPGSTSSDLMLAGLAFTAVSLVLNLLALPLHFALPLIGTIVVLLINGYLTGRTYFELAALRHLKPPEARKLRREHRVRLFLGGALISVLAMIPFVNFVVPVFAAAMMTHEYQKLARGPR
jgi:CysZ protein